MKITIDITAKEIADLVVGLQSRLGVGLGELDEETLSRLLSLKVDELNELMEKALRINGEEINETSGIESIRVPLPEALLPKN